MMYYPINITVMICRRELRGMLKGIHTVDLDSRLLMFSSRFGDRSYKKKHKLECINNKQLNGSENSALSFIDNIRVVWYYSDIIAM